MTQDPENALAWQVEQYLLGELTADERAALERDPSLAGRVAALQASDAAILEEHPPAAFAAAVRAALRTPRLPAPRRRALRSPQLLAAAALGAAAVVAVLWLAPRTPLPSAPPDVTRAKGLVPQVLLYRRAAAGAERLAAGSVAREHDLLQLAYQAAGRRHGVIASIDGRGVVTLHLPASGPSAAPLASGAAVPLAEAYELDDAPGFERFYLVVSNEPFPVAVVLAALPRAGADGRLDLPSSLEQYSLVIEKETLR
ncbi:MAG: hypothetical protein ABW221_13740 [Vicinamibacteria bacterium]